MPEPPPIAGSMSAPQSRPRPATCSSRAGRVRQVTRQVWAMVRLASKTFFQIDGTQWAGAFAFNAFFSLFPLIVLLVTLGSFFVDRDRAGNEIVAYLEGHVPLSGEQQQQVVETFAGVVKARGQAGAIAVLMLVWAALQCCNTLIGATNRAWGLEGYNWWQLPLKSLALVGILAGVVLLGLGVPVLLSMAKGWLLPGHQLGSWAYGLGTAVIPSLVVFLGLSLFYRLAPRRPTRSAEVWIAAVAATVLLRAAEALFVIYLRDYATLNAVYGAFGGIMALLLWIYVAGCLFIFGACLCSARDEVLRQFAGGPTALVG
jgi:YihY family inner membrane protein